MSVAASSPAWLTRIALSRYSRCFLVRMYLGLPVDVLGTVSEPSDPFDDVDGAEK